MIDLLSPPSDFNNNLAYGEKVDANIETHIMQPDATLLSDDSNDSVYCRLKKVKKEKGLRIKSIKDLPFYLRENLPSEKTLAAKTIITSLPKNIDRPSVE